MAINTDYGNVLRTFAASNNSASKTDSSKNNWELQNPEKGKDETNGTNGTNGTGEVIDAVFAD